MTTHTQDKLFNLLHRAKQPWEVTPTSNSPVLPGAEETIQRALALRHLELPVGDWITNASKREQEELGTTAMALLASNIEDELRHDRQLNNAFSAMKLTSEDTKAQIEAEAKDILNRWLEAASKYHPAAVAYNAEAGVFIPALTAFRRLGGVALTNIANDISRDESVHLRAHREVGIVIGGESLTKELDTLRTDTLDWLFQDLKNSEIPGKYGKKRTYLAASKNLVYNKVAPEFKETKRATQIAFFEVQNSNIPVYGK